MDSCSSPRSGVMSNFTADASCTYGETAPTAILEKELVLSCSLTCFSNVYEWFNITDGNVRLSTEKNSTFVVSEKVHSVTEVGGHKYMCQCNALLATECFRIGGMYCCHWTEYRGGVEIQVSSLGN